MGFNLTKDNFNTAAQKGFTFELIDPAGNDTGAKFTVIGELSPEVFEYEKKALKELTLKQTVSKGKQKEWMPEPEDLIESATEAALVRLVGWEGVTDGDDDKPVKFTKEKAKEVLRQFSFMREQIFERSKDISNFTPQKTSKT